MRGQFLRLDSVSLILFACLLQFGITDTVFHCIVESGHTVLHAEAGNLPGIFQRGGDSLRQLAIDRHTAAYLQESRQGGAFQFCHRPFDRACAGDDCLGIAFQQTFQLFCIAFSFPDVDGVSGRIKKSGTMANILHNGDVGQVCGIFHTVHQIAMLGVCPLQRGVVQVFAFGQIVLLQSIDASEFL